MIDFLEGPQRKHLPTRGNSGQIVILIKIYKLLLSISFLCKLKIGSKITLDLVPELEYQRSSER